MIHFIKKTYRKAINYFGFSSTRIISIGFLLVILLGTTLLCLPISTKNGEGADFLTALFTATSATCVTGLIVEDTYQFWSLFGQIVIISLIQIGGLGFMAIATLFSIIVRRTISLKERLLISEAIGYGQTAGVVRISVTLLMGTLIFEGIGAIVLSFRFIPEFGTINGIFKGVFHSVSAFCNAGFDLMGQNSSFSSLTSYTNDWIVNLTIAFLIIIGGLGFVVWEDVYRQRCWKKLNLHSKISIVMAAILIISGSILFFVFEYANTATLGTLRLDNKILASFFQSVTPRTAGFNTVNLNGLTSAGCLLLMILMFIGGSSGSTAGGVKTGTIGVLVFASVATLKGSDEVNIFKRSISKDTALRSLTIVLIAVSILICGIILLCFLEPEVPFIDIVFEAVSAFATVGLTKSLTPTLHATSKMVLILLMYIGRIGVLTLILSMIRKRTKFKNCIKYPKGKIFV